MLQSFGMEIISPYFGKTVKVKVSDNRIIEGDFQALDKDMSIVIGSATEYHDVPNGDINLTGSAGLARRLGMTIIPGKYIVSVSVNKDS